MGLESESNFFTRAHLITSYYFSVKGGADPVSATLCSYHFVNFITLNDGRGPRNRDIKCDIPFTESIENKFYVLCRLWIGHGREVVVSPRNTYKLVRQHFGFFSLYSWWDVNIKLKGSSETWGLHLWYCRKFVSSSGLWWCGCWVFECCYRSANIRSQACVA